MFDREINFVTKRWKKGDESRSHKITANRIAKKTNTEYNDGKVVDIKSTNATIDVETPQTMGDALEQLRIVVRSILPARTRKRSIKLWRQQTGLRLALWIAKETS